jgi:carbon monoxide dehydrogenase subunit G
MKVNGSAVLHAAPDAVFAALNDPAVLARTIPGCRSLSPLADDRYAMTVTAGVASVKGSYEGRIAITDKQPPHAFTLRANGSGAPGTVDTTVRVTLAAEDGSTRVEYDADAVVGGMVGGVGQRMLASVARRTAGQFFAAVDGELRGEPAAPGGGVGAAAVPAAAVPAAAVPAAAVPPAAGTGSAEAAPVPVAARPVAAQAMPSAGADDRVPFHVVLAGVGVGAFWALAGVLVGWRIARGGAGRRR